MYQSWETWLPWLHEFSLVYLFPLLFFPFIRNCQSSMDIVRLVLWKSEVTKNWWVEGEFMGAGGWDEFFRRNIQFWIFWLTINWLYRQQHSCKYEWSYFKISVFKFSFFINPMGKKIRAILNKGERGWILRVCRDSINYYSYSGWSEGSRSMSECAK